MAYTCRYSTGPPKYKLLGLIHFSFVSLSKTLEFFTLLTSEEALAPS